MDFAGVYCIEVTQEIGFCITIDADYHVRLLRRNDNKADRGSGGARKGGRTGGWAGGLVRAGDAE